MRLVCAEPFAGKETVIGTVGGDYIVVEPMSDYQRCTPSSVASHAMYERIDPYWEYVPGGYVDMSACVYEAVDERRTRVTGSKFVTSEQYTVKLEGAGKVGERCLMVVGIRDPYVITHLDEAIAWSRKKVKERFGDTGYDVYYHVYGKNGVMGELEPITDIRFPRTRHRRGRSSSYIRGSERVDEFSRSQLHVCPVKKYSRYRRSGSFSVR